MSNHYATNLSDDFMAEPEDAQDDGRAQAMLVEESRSNRVDPLAQPASDRLALHLAPIELPNPSPWLKHFTSIPLLTLLLVAAISFGSWGMYTLGSERDALEHELRREMNAHRQARLAARSAEVNLATYIRLNEVRREFVGQPAGTQEARAAERKQQAEKVPPQKLAETDCSTPRSILKAAGL